MNFIQELSMPWWQFVVRGIAVYLALLCMMRLTGKRSFGEMSAFDLAFERALHAEGLEDEASIVTARLQPDGRITVIQRHA